MWNNQSQTCVTDATPWDFSNQSVYMYKEPLVVKGADRMRLSCTYDTRTRTEVARGARELGQATMHPRFSAASHKRRSSARRAAYDYLSM